MSWRPAAASDALLARAQMLHDIRAFFRDREVLEVETPALSQAANSDPAIASITVSVASSRGYLHTSPEFPMKRLLAAGSGDIYQVCKVFRDGESGRYHNPEFTLLEWYRLGFNDRHLSNEVLALIRSLSQEDLDCVSVSYSTLFQQCVGLNPLLASVIELETIALERSIHPGCRMAKDDWLDLLMSHTVTPAFPENRLTVVHDYPASQAALARLNPDGETAARFEIYWGATELANGYHELTDGAEQRRRIERALQQRRETQRPLLPADERFMQAVDAGLPDCAGVALGLDRLLMKLLGVPHINNVIAFPFDRA